MDGSYTNIPASGGSGSGATFNFTISGGSISSFTINNPGAGYVDEEDLTILVLHLIMVLHLEII